MRDIQFKKRVATYQIRHVKPTKFCMNSRIGRLSVQADTSQTINNDLRQLGKLLFIEEQRRILMKGKPDMTLKDFSANVECGWKYLTQVSIKPFNPDDKQAIT